MNNTFLIALLIYLLTLILISLNDRKKIHNVSDYTVAGRNQAGFTVTMTLLATMIGASTTIGITDTVYVTGFPGIWWLVFGAAGLLFQAVFIAEKVRSFHVSTLPELAGRLVGRPAGMLLAFVIVLSWVGVIAGQLVAMNSLITFATGRNSRTLFLVVSGVVILYTLVGGQLSVVKTDRLQLVILLAGVISCFVFLYGVKGGNLAYVRSHIDFLNENYGPVNLFTQFFVVGGVFFLGPDIMSRNFISKDEKTAKRATITAALILLIFSVIITMIGMWIRANVMADELGSSKALLYVVELLPKFLAVLLIFGLFSAILSSADTCIINASTIFVKDILGKDNVMLIRITVAVMGGLSTLLCVTGSNDIMTLLSNAYSIYTPGVIFPLLIAILAYGKREIRMPVWLLAVILGGGFGLCNAYLHDFLIRQGISGEILSYFSLIGMGVSLLVALFSVKWNEGGTIMSKT